MFYVLQNCCRLHFLSQLYNRLSVSLHTDGLCTESYEHNSNMYMTSTPITNHFFHNTHTYTQRDTVRFLNLSCSTARVLPLSSQESDWKEFSDWTSELLPLLLPEKQVTSSPMSTILPVGRRREQRQNKDTTVSNPNVSCYLPSPPALTTLQIVV